MSPLEALLRTNPAYVDSLYRQWRESPSSVEPTFAAFFAGYEHGLAEGVARPAEDAGEPVVLTAHGDVPEGAPAHAITAGLRIYDLLHAYRAWGHLAADLDPLGRSPRENPLLELSQFGFEERDLDQVVRCEAFKGPREATVREHLEWLRATYCGPVGVEYVDVTEREQRDWLQERLEPARSRVELGEGEKRRLLDELVAADLFEETIHRLYPGAKRFSLEGGATLVPLLNELVRGAASAGMAQLVMGMAHRGRLNVLANVLGKPLEHILAEFEGRPLPPEALGYGDVKYHLGYSRVHEEPNGERVALALEFNPSHLEAVDPVVEGIVRAKQDRIGDAGRERVMAVLLHGDAAFAGQGVVAETFLLDDLPGYRTGGTIHVLVNNQVGFTTDPEEARSTRHASDIAKIARAPVFHVNADDAEAVVFVARLALAWRLRFRQDVVIDLVCYRRHGHNEVDDPTFTQPVTYAKVRTHPSNHRVYASRLVAERVVSEDEVAARVGAARARIEAAREAARTLPELVLEKPRGAWEGYRAPLTPEDWAADTRVERAALERVARAFTAVPDGFTWHPRLRKLMTQRAAMVLEDAPLDWGCAEALAFGTLVAEGVPVRLSGQDSGRGTFSHRHGVYSDFVTGERWTPLEHVAPEQARFEVLNSPLSEEAVLGFEYGYSTADPRPLVLWEAQFGDFANGAQVVIDQLLAAGEVKWGRWSGLALLLPHGYEGQGPEHSSARLERFLELCAEDNLQVMNLTTPAQLFHALRRQVKRGFRRPLVLMSPKSLLRHPRATSRVDELVSGSFRELLDDAAVPDRSRVRRALPCSGKVALALEEARRERGRDDVAILRLEQLYPFPRHALVEALAGYPALAELVWVQEEPRNMGAWRQLRHRLEQALPDGVRLGYAGRASAASPATGSFEVHQREEAALLEQAFAPLPDARPRATTRREEWAT